MRCSAPCPVLVRLAGFASDGTAFGLIYSGILIFPRLFPSINISPLNIGRTSPLIAVVLRGNYRNLGEPAFRTCKSGHAAWLRKQPERNGELATFRAPNTLGRVCRCSGSCTPARVNAACKSWPYIVGTLQTNKFSTSVH